MPSKEEAELWKKQLVERENKRKEYDHYEQKLLKIKDSKDKKYIERID